MIDKARELKLDFADPMAARDVFSDEKIDILINNAGIIRRADAVDFSEADWDDVMDVNLEGGVLHRPGFRQGSAGAFRHRHHRQHRLAAVVPGRHSRRLLHRAKHGVAGLTRLLCNEWAAKGINVNAIAPGYISTNNTEALRADPVRNKAILERIPAGRWGEASDIGDAAVFLASPAAKYVHGTVLSVDGGWLAR